MPIKPPDDVDLRRPHSPHRWHAPDIPDEKRPQLVFDYVRAIEERQSEVRIQMFRNAYLYTGEELEGVRVDWQRRSPGRPELPRINVVGSVIETAYSRMMMREPRLAVVTKGGNWDLRQRAKGLEQWLEGKMHETRFAGEWARASCDGAALGTGLVKWYRIGDEIQCDRVFPVEIVVDEVAAHTAPPLAMFQRRFVDVDEAAAEWPEQRDLIWRAAGKQMKDFVSYISYPSYTVPIIEAWRVATPTRPGMHLSCLEGGILGEIEEWPHPYFPFTEFRWMRKLTGWYGIGIPEVVFFLQARVNRHAAYVMACQNRAVSPVILVDQPDAQLGESLTNDLGQVVPWTGRTPPQFITPPQVAPEIYADEERKIRQIYQISGMSEFAAGAKARPPTGLDSAPALEEWIDYTEGRFARQEKAFDQGWVDGGEIAIDIATDLAAEGKMPRATWQAPRYGLIELNWRKVRMDKEDYRLMVKPAASTPETPAGLRQRLEVERASGRLADDLYRYFVQTLDVEAYYNLYDAAVSNMMRTIWVLEDLEQPFPTPAEYQPLDLGLWMVQMEINKIAGIAPPEVLARLSIWMEQAENLKALGLGAPVPSPAQLGPAQAGGGPQAPQLQTLARLPVPGLA